VQGLRAIVPQDKASKHNFTANFTTHLEMQGKRGVKSLENIWMSQVRMQKASLIESEGGEEGQVQYNGCAGWCP
jgi:hypothetical protein